jgi:hypothetical protein
MFVVFAIDDDENFELTDFLPYDDVDLPILSRPLTDDLLIGGNLCPGRKFALNLCGKLLEALPPFCTFGGHISVREAITQLSAVQGSTLPLPWITLVA